MSRVRKARIVSQLMHVHHGPFQPDNFDCSLFWLVLLPSFGTCSSLSSFYFTLPISSLIRSWNVLQSNVIISPHSEPGTYFPSLGRLILSFPAAFNISLNKGAQQGGLFFKKKLVYELNEISRSISLLRFNLLSIGVLAVAATVWYTVVCSKTLAFHGWWLSKSNQIDASNNNSPSLWAHSGFLILWSVCFWVFFFPCKTRSGYRDSYKTLIWICSACVLW